jgi:predicted SprT family Zn-dependent metalloprotease
VSGQLDFFSKLTTALRGLARNAPPSSAPAPSTDLEEKARELLRGVGRHELAARVKVKWNPRMRSTAGMAYAHQALIVINPRLQQFGEEEVDRTLRHELAHLLAHDRAGRKRISPHGPEWQKACRDLGMTDEKRCHDLPLPRRNVPRRHVYQCPACATLVPRARPLRRRSACFHCCRKHNRGQYDEKYRLVKVAG